MRAEKRSTLAKNTAVPLLMTVTCGVLAWSSTICTLSITSRKPLGPTATENVTDASVLSSDISVFWYTGFCSRRRARLAISVASLGLRSSGCTFMSASVPEMAWARSAVTLNSVCALTPGTLARSRVRSATTRNTSGRKALPPSAAPTPTTTTYFEPKSVSAAVVPITLGCSLGSIADGSITMFRWRNWLAKNSVRRLITRISQNRLRTMAVARVRIMMVAPGEQSG